MLRQIERNMQNRPIINTGVLPQTTLFYLNLNLSIRTSVK